MSIDNLFFWENQEFIKIEEANQKISYIINNALITRNKDARRAKKFYEEVAPMTYLANKLGATEIRYTNDKKKSLSLDAIIKYSNKVEDKIEATYAVDGQNEAIIGECLAKYGHAPVLLPIEYTGTQHNRKIQEPQKFQSVLVSQAISSVIKRIKNVINKKITSAKEKGKYHSMLLCVVVNTNGINLSQLKQEILENKSEFNNRYFRKIFFVSSNPNRYEDSFLELPLKDTSCETTNSIR